MLNEIRKIIKLYDKGILSEKEAEKQITLYSHYASDDASDTPIIDVFGLGEEGDPDAYKDGKPTFPFHHLL